LKKNYPQPAEEPSQNCKKFDPPTGKVKSEVFSGTLYLKTGYPQNLRRLRQQKGSTRGDGWIRDGKHLFKEA